MNQAVKKSAVLYHYPCPDGAFAALAAHLYFSALSLPAVFFPNTVYSPVRAESIPHGEFDDVYLLDFIGPPGFLKQISSKANRVIILDHHKTALEELTNSDHQHSSNVTKIIDMERSGATIAYDFFREKLLKKSISLGHDSIGVNAWPLGKLASKKEAERVSRIFKLIEDGDLWRWAISDSKAFYHGLKSMNIEFNVNLNTSMFDQLLVLDPDFIIDCGKETMLRKQKLIDEAVDQSYEVALGGGLFGYCLAANADAFSDLRSDIGHQLAEKSQRLGLRGVGAVIYTVPELGDNHLLKVSLRSIDKEDTTAISQAFGGGGHRNASSFMVDSSQFDQWKVITKAN